MGNRKLKATRYTDAEMQIIRRAAAAANVTISTIIRGGALDKARAILDTPKPTYSHKLVDAVLPFLKRRAH